MLTFNNTADNSTYTLTLSNSTDAIVMDNGAAAATLQNLTNNNQISAPMVLASNTKVITGSATTLTINGVISGSGSLSIDPTNLGTLSLSATAANTFTGGVNIDGSGRTATPGDLSDSLTVINDNLLGPSTNTINFAHNGILTYSVVPPSNTNPQSPTRIFNFGTGGGTINAAGGAGTAGKILLNNPGQLVGSGTFTKEGAGDFQIAANSANPGFTGSTIINGGFVEVQNVLSLGGTPTVTANTGGELVISNGINFPNPIVLNGGTLSTNITGSISSGGINVTAPSTIAARQFQTVTNASNLYISGALTGSQSLTINGATVNQGVVTFTGTDAGFTGTIIPGATGIFRHTNASTFTANMSVAGGFFGLASDGNGYGTPESFNFNDTINITTSPAGMSVDRVGNPFSLFATALNKTLLRLSRLPSTGHSHGPPIITVTAGVQ